MATATRCTAMYGEERYCTAMYGDSHRGGKVLHLQMEGSDKLVNRTLTHST